MTMDDTVHATPGHPHCMSDSFVNARLDVMSLLPFVSDPIVSAITLVGRDEVSRASYSTMMSLAPNCEYHCFSSCSSISRPISGGRMRHVDYHNIPFISTLLTTLFLVLDSGI